jgi:pumilio family protein 6
MAGIKRRVDVADDRGGKRPKVKKDTLKQQEADIKAKKSAKVQKQRKVESSEEEADDMGFNDEDQPGFLSEDEDSEGGMDLGGEVSSKSDTQPENSAALKNGKRPKATWEKDDILIFWPQAMGITITLESRTQSKKP